MLCISIGIEKWVFKLELCDEARKGVYSWLEDCKFDFSCSSIIPLSSKVKGMTLGYSWLPGFWVVWSEREQERLRVYLDQQKAMFYSLKCSFCPFLCFGRFPIISSLECYLSIYAAYIDTFLNSIFIPPLNSYSFF